MNLAPESVAIHALPRSQRSRFLRFSLRSLLCFVLLVGAAGLTVKNWAPWVLEYSLANVTFSPYCTRAFVPEGTFSTTIWDLENGRRLESHPFTIKDRVFSSDSRYAAVLSDSDEWHLLRLADGKRVITLSNVLRLDQGAFSPDSERLVGLNQYLQFAVFSTETGKQLFVFDEGKKIKRLEFLNDGYLRAHYAGNFGVIDPQTGKPTLRIEGIAADVNSHVSESKDKKDKSLTVQFSDGRFVTSASNVLDVCDANRRVLWHLERTKPPTNAQGGIHFSWFAPHFDCYLFDHEHRLVAYRRTSHSLNSYYNRYPEQWWGVAWMPEFWLAAVLLILFGWSIKSDWRTGKQKI